VRWWIDDTPSWRPDADWRYASAVVEQPRVHDVNVAFGAGAVR
jgi:hypothetical protein